MKDTVYATEVQNRIEEVGNNTPQSSDTARRPLFSARIWARGTDFEQIFKWSKQFLDNVSIFFNDFAFY
jgi:hypothetical protein